MPTRVLLIDDHAVFREMAAQVLSAEPDLDVVGCVDSVEHGLQLISRALVDIVLLDYDLRGQNGIDFIPAAKRQGFTGQCLIVSAGIPVDDLFRALQDGASGLVLKEDSLDRLMAAIRAVAEGRTWLDPKFLHLLLMPPQVVDHLTVRERLILRGLIEGLSNRDIAEELKIPETSVKSGLQTLFRKTGVRTRGSLIRIAIEKWRPLLSRVHASGASQ